MIIEGKHNCKIVRFYSEVIATSYTLNEINPRISL